MFTLTIETDNAAFEESPHELVRLIEIAAEKVRDGSADGRLVDINGNTVGQFTTDDA
jgi:hypothetical protein